MHVLYAAVPTLATLVAAFPAAMTEGLRRSEQLDFVSIERRLNGIDPGFDASKQHITVTGSHKFVAPGPTDLRGPCPGLNALANHNYLPHNGYATITEFITQTNAVFGMGLDLAGFLAVYGAVFDGDLVGWSIGGPAPTSLLSPVAGLLGTPQGISGSHNKYESDVSPTRGDLYEYGNDYLVQMDQFKALYSFQSGVSDADSNYDLGILQSHRVNRFQQSITKNPYFFNGPFSGVLVQPAAYTFIYRFMSNKSAEYPEGRLTQSVLKSFFSITGDYPDFKYTPGHERIPENWYKRAVGDDYTITFFNSDLLAEAIQFPQFLDIGGNTGKVNTFTGVNLENVTGGLYNAATLTEGNNALCLAYQGIIQAAPDLLDGLFSNVDKALAKLDGALSKAFGDFGCPRLDKSQQKQFNEALQQYPGYTKLKTGGTY